MVRRTGAEKPRSSEGVGGEGMSRNSKTCSRSVTSSRPSVRGAPPSSFKGSSSPFAPISPTLSGISIGSFLVWPGVGGTTWLTESRAVLACGS